MPQWKVSSFCNYTGQEGRASARNTELWMFPDFLLLRRPCKHMRYFLTKTPVSLAKLGKSRIPF